MNKVLITGPYVPRQHRYGTVIEEGDRMGNVWQLIVIGQFKGQVVTLPYTWWNRLSVWLFEIRYEED